MFWFFVTVRAIKDKNKEIKEAFSIIIVVLVSNVTRKANI